MTNQDLSRFTEIMTGMAECFPSGRISHLSLELSYQALKKYSLDQITRAVSRLLISHKFNTMPTIADIAETIDQAEGKIPVEDKAEVQAGIVLEFLRTCGRDASPMFSDPITRHLMTTRWRYRQWAAYVIESDLKWWRREFIETYKAHASGVESGYFFPAGEKLRKIAQGVTMAIPSRREAANVR